MLGPNETTPAIAALTRVHVLPILPTHRSAGMVGLQDISLRIQKGEIVSLLDAEMGGGADSVLAVFAGTVRASAGQVALDSKLVGTKLPHQRMIGLVSRDLMLFPTHTVIEHARFSPGVSAKRCDAVLERLELTVVARQRPAELSPSQQFRVALARALARGPKLLLLQDPPGGLSADPTLKPLLRSIASETQTAILHACGDVASVYSFADRVGVLNFGWMQQIGAPLSLYDRPDSLTVARAMGALNLLEGVVVDSEEDVARIRLTGGPLVEARAGQQLQPNEPCVVALRPERIAVAAMRPDELGDGAVPVWLIETMFAGEKTVMRFRMDARAPSPNAANLGDAQPRASQELIVTRPSSAAPLRGQMLSLAWQAHQAHAFRLEVA